MRDFLINCSPVAYFADFQLNIRMVCRPGKVVYLGKLLVLRVLDASCRAIWLVIKALAVWGKEKVNFFEKILQKNLEVKKKSVSLQPI